MDVRELMKKRIFLNEYNLVMGDTTYLPIVSGILHANAIKNEVVKENYDFMPYSFHVDAAEDIISRHEEPYVAAFSLSMWNEQLSLKVASEVKRRHPDSVIVVGGPQVPHHPQDYFARYPFIDVAVRGEGEETFRDILVRLAEGRDLDGLPGVTWRTPTGEIHRADETRPFNRDLDVYPSPYLEGLFDPLIAGHPEFKFQAIIETNRGCPFHCTFCFWGMGGLSRKYRYHGLDRVRAELEWMARNKVLYVFNADSNFGMHERDAEIADMLVEIKQRYGYPEKFRTCYGKNTNDRIFEIGKLLHQHQLEKGITISYQSLDGEVQKNIKRDNIKLAIAHELQHKFNRHRVPVYTELILGLPGETVESWTGGIDQVLAAGLKNQLFLYICEVLPNTDLADPGYQAQHQIVTRRVELTEIHSSPRADGWVKEYEDIVVSTGSLPLTDWRRMQMFSWYTMLLHGLKVGFFVMAFLHREMGLSYRQIIASLYESLLPGVQFPVLNQLRSLTQDKLERILLGEGRGSVAPLWGDIYWEQEELLFFLLALDWDRFYAEMRQTVSDLLTTQGLSCDPLLLDEVFRYQRLRMPGLSDLPEAVHFAWNLPEYFDQIFTEAEAAPKMTAMVGSTSPQNFADDPKAFAINILRKRKNGDFLTPVTWTTATGPNHAPTGLQ